MIDANALDPRMARIVETLASGDGARMEALRHPEILEHYRFKHGLLIGIRPFYWDTAALLELIG